MIVWLIYRSLNLLLVLSSPPTKELVVITSKATEGSNLPHWNSDPGWAIFVCEKNLRQFCFNVKNHILRYFLTSLKVILLAIRWRFKDMPCYKIILARSRLHKLKRKIILCKGQDKIRVLEFALRQNNFIFNVIKNK